jgi:hypothetical protein
MFSRFFGGRNSQADLSDKDALDSRGSEVIEDDADTAWSRWDAALTQEQALQLGLGYLGQPLPCITGNMAEAVSHSSEPTQPMKLEDLSLEQRKNRALVIIQEHHPRIASSIRTLWGYRECTQYINKLIMEGLDGKGHARVGFNQVAAQAMLELTEVHEAMFGSARLGSSDKTAASQGWNRAG